MPFVENGGAHIYYDVLGEGPDLVFLHGGGGNSTSWWQQIGDFSRHYRCTFIDNRCFGRSHPVSADLCLPAEFVGDVLAVMDAVGAMQAGLVCQSMGGWTGLRLALDHPDRVWAFACSSSPMGVNYPPALADVAVFARGLDEEGAQIEDAALSPAFRQNRPEAYWLYSQLNMFNVIPLRGEAIGVPAQVMMARLFDPDYMLAPEALSAVKTPTLLIGGEEDRLVRPDTTRALAGYIDGAAVMIFEESGHSPYFEIPDQFNIVVAKFLAAAAPER